MPGAGDAEEGWEDVSSNIIFLGGSPNFKQCTNLRRSVCALFYAFGKSLCNMHTEK